MSKKPITKKMETEADYFARCLLMPAELFMQSMKGVSQVTDDPDKIAYVLAEMYQVPLTQCVLRIKELS